MSPALVVVPNRGLLVAASILATLMYTIDFTIANVALPHIMGNLQAAQDQVLWVVTSYMASSAVSTVLIGYLAVRYGERKVLIGSVAGFTVASMLCGIATSMPELVVFRALQGMSGAALVPISQSVMLSVFPREAQGRALGLWGLGVLVGPIAGPTIGGWLTDTWNWRWVFFVNVPVGALALIALTASLPKTPGRADRQFEVKGFVMLAGALALAQIAFDRGSSQGWFDSLEICVEMLFAAILFYMFVVQSLTVEHPFFERALFRDRNLVVSCLILMVAYPIIMVGSAMLPTFMQHVQGHTAMQTGMIMGPRGIGTAVSMMVGGRLAGKYDMRVLALTAIALLIGASVPLTHLTNDSPARLIAWVSAVQGFGMGLFFVSVNAAAYATLPTTLRTEASVFLTLARTIAGAVTVSFAGAILSNSTAANHARLVEFITPFSGSDAGVPGVDPLMAHAMLEGEIERQATIIGYNNVFGAMVIMALIAAVLLVFCKPQPPGTFSSEDAPTLH